jgi:hypothetical protein
MQKQLAFMLGRQQIFLELNENIVEYDDLVEIMSNAHLNNHFLNLAREVSRNSHMTCIVTPLCSSSLLLHFGCGYISGLIEF